MRSITGGERSAIAAPAGHWLFAYLEVTNFDGTWIHLGELAYGARTIDALTSAVITDNIDANTLSMTAVVRRNVGNFSLSPFRSDSPWNVDDSGSLYQPLLDLHRQWRLWVAVLARGTFPADPSDYREMARGVVDKIVIAGDPATITLTGRGPEADLIDHWIPTDNPTTYPGAPIGDMLQAILDNELGAGAVTLVLDPSAPSEFINDYTPAGIGLMAALTSIANLATGVLRFRYDASDVLALTLFTPNRTPVSPDWSLDSGAEIEALDASMELGSVANNIVVRYMDANGVIQTVTSPASGTSASIDRYGLRTTEIDLSADTRVRTSTAAQGLADAVCADRQWPLLDQQATAAGIWFGDLWDFVGIGANGIHFDQDQNGGVVALEHRLDGGDLTSSFGLSGAPKGRYTTWDTFGGPAAAPVVPTLTSLSATYTETLLLIRIRTLTGVGIAGQSTRSVRFEFSDVADFATVYATSDVAATPGENVSSFTLLTPLGTGGYDKTYYVRATPYSGPLVAGAVSGVAGERYEAHTYNPLKPSDSPTVTVNYDTPGEISFDVVGLPTIDDGLDQIAGTLDEIGTPIWFYKTPLASAQWLIMDTIPTAEEEMGSEFRRQHYLVGAGRGRWHAIVKSVTGTPTVKLKSSTDGFGSSADVDSLSITGAGYLLGSWIALPSTAHDDVRVSPFLLNGADTASVDFYALWYEVLPDLITAFRDFSDDFSDDFS